MNQMMNVNYLTTCKAAQLMNKEHKHVLDKLRRVFQARPDINIEKYKSSYFNKHKWLPQYNMPVDIWEILIASYTRKSQANFYSSLREQPPITNFVVKPIEVEVELIEISLDTLVESGVIQLPQIVKVKNHLGQNVKVYRLTKRDSYVVVAQLSPEFTARLVDRWRELEGYISNRPTQTVSP